MGTALAQVTRPPRPARQELDIEHRHRFYVNRSIPPGSVVRPNNHSAICVDDTEGEGVHRRYNIDRAGIEQKPTGGERRERGFSI